MEPTTDPPFNAHLDSPTATESEEPSPYKPSPTHADLIASPIDYFPALSPKLSLALTPDNKYKKGQSDSVGEYCTIISVKLACQKDLLVWITCLAGQH